MSQAAAAVLMSAAWLLAAPALDDDLPRAEDLLKDVQGWWALDEGRTLVVQHEGRLQWLDPGERKLMPLLPPPALLGQPIRRVYRLGKDTLGVAMPNQGFALVDAGTGKVATPVTGAGDYEAFGIKPGRGWFLVAAMRPGADPYWEFHRVDLKTRTAKLAHRLNDPRGLSRAFVTEDGKRLALWWDVPGAANVRGRLVHLETDDTAAVEVPRGEGVHPLLDGSGHLVLKTGRLYLVRQGKEKDLFEGAYRAAAQAAGGLRPRWLAVSRLTDTNKDGKISGKTGDWSEIWLVDLATGGKKLLADATCENLLRGWSATGDRLVYKRWEKPADGGRAVSALVVHEPSAGKTHYVFPAPGCLSVRRLQFLGGPWLLARGMDLTGRDPFKGRPFVVNYREGTPRALAPALTGRAAVVGDWLILTDKRPGTKTQDLRRWRIAAGN